MREDLLSKKKKEAGLDDLGPPKPSPMDKIKRCTVMKGCSTDSLRVWVYNLFLFIRKNKISYYFIIKNVL